MLLAHTTVGRCSRSLLKLLQNLITFTSLWRKLHSSALLEADPSASLHSVNVTDSMGLTPLNIFP